MKTKQIGEILQEEREKKGFSLEDFVARTRIRLEYIQALEKNEFSKLPAATFVKGYIKTYARELEFDPDPLVALLRRDFKESVQGKLVPREFIKPLLKKQRAVAGVTLFMLALGLVFITLIGYVGVQWFNLQKPPELSILTPKDAQVVSGAVIVRGRAARESVVTINTQPVATQLDGSFETTISLDKAGVSTLVIEAVDSRGKQNKKQVTVYVQF